MPGIAYRRLYYAKEFSHQFFRETFFSVFTATIGPALILHAVWFFIVPGYQTSSGSSFYVDLEMLSNLLAESPPEGTFSRLENVAWPIFFYNSTLIGFSAIFGAVMRHFVRELGLDIDYQLFRYQNPWHYKITGEVYLFPENRLKLKEDKLTDISFRFIEAVQEIAGEAYLYTGILVGYELSKDGGLNSLTLQYAKRRLLRQDKKPISSPKKAKKKERYYKIEGHLLVLKFENLKNVNIHYRKKRPNGKDDTDSDPIR